MTVLRIIIALIGFVGAIFLPWWVPALCIVLLAIRWRSYEAIVLGVLMDLLWLSPHSGWHGVPLFTLGSILIVWIFEPLRKEFLS